jgi:excinuclease UvrABC nuclease subunit
MTKPEFLKKYKKILKSRKGTKQEQGVVGSADDRSKCDFTGVYAVFNNDVLVYVGSGYTPKKHNVKKRFAQYASKSSGNTLLKKVLNDGLALDNDSAIELIKTFEFIAFEHNDLENELIEQTQLDWNIKGKKKKK